VTVHCAHNQLVDPRKLKPNPVNPNRHSAHQIAKLFADADPAEDLETIPLMECQAFEHHDYVVFMFHDLRDWMLALQLIGVKEVDYSITRKTKKIGIGRVLNGKRLIELAQKAASAALAPTAG